MKPLWENMAFERLCSQESAELTSLFITSCPRARLQDIMADEDVLALVGDLLADPEYLARQQFLSRILRLAPPVQMKLLEAINGSAGYALRRPNLVTKLLNVGTIPVDVVVAERNIPYSLTDGPGHVSGTYENEKIRRRVEPGQFVELGSDRAIAALRTFCRTVLPPSRWRKGWLWPATQDCLIEVGYQFSLADHLTGDLRTGESSKYESDTLTPYVPKDPKPATDDAVTTAKAAIRQAKGRKQ